MPSKKRMMKKRSLFSWWGVLHAMVGLLSFVSAFAQAQEPTSLLPDAVENPLVDPGPLEAPPPAAGSEPLVPSSADPVVTEGLAPAQSQPDGSSREALPQTDAKIRQEIWQDTTKRLLDFGAQLLSEDLNGIGTLSAGHGGLGEDMWDKTSHERAVHLLAGLSERPVLRQAAILFDRLILSASRPPVRPDGVAGLLVRRLSVLVKQNRFAALNDLFARIPKELGSQDSGAELSDILPSLRAEAVLFSGDYDRFCQDALPALLAVESLSPASAQRQIFCQIHRGETDQALLGLDLLREVSADSDPLFTQLAFRAVGLERPITGESAGPVQVLHLALAEKSGTALPENLLDWVQGDLLLKIARSDLYTVAQRLAAAEKALRSGLIPPSVLWTLYQDLPVVVPESEGGQESVVARLLSVGAGLDPVLRHAVFWREMSNQTLDAVRAELLQSVFEQALDHEEEFLMALIYQEILASIAPTEDLTWFAATAGRALYVAGRPQAAGQWFDLVREQSSLRAEAAVSVTALRPYARLAGFNGVSDAQQPAVRDGDPVQQSKAIVLHSLLQGLGLSGETAWAMLVAPDGAQGLVPSAAVYFALRDAASQQKRAEVVTLILILLGATPAEGIHPLVFETVLNSLVQVGLVRDARQLAVDVAFLNGI